MTIIEKINSNNRPLISVEFFPPKSDGAKAAFDKSAMELLELRPDFASVTCGAGGSAAGPTLSVSRQLAADGYKTVMPHCTCVGMSRSDLEKSSDELVANGFNHIMALRGDPPRGEKMFVPAADGFRYATELVAFLRVRHPKVCIGVAGYPEKHPEAASLDEDIRRLKEKVDAGADFITTQLFFKNRIYFEFVDRCRVAGITVPILPGLLPATSLEQIQRMKTFCDFSMPAKLLSDFERAQNHPAKMERLGLYWAMEQIADLVESGAPGVHLYLLNRSKTAFYPELLACLKRVRNEFSRE